MNLTHADALFRWWGADATDDEAPSDDPGEEGEHDFDPDEIEVEDPEDDVDEDERAVLDVRGADLSPPDEDGRGDAVEVFAASSWEHIRADTDLSDTPAERDQRIQQYDRNPSHQEVREHLRSTGLIDEIQAAIDDLGESEEQITDPEGAVFDMPNVMRRLAGDTRVKDYYRRRVTVPGDRIAVGVSLDLSGSMASDELEAKAAVGAFLFAVQQAGGEVVANAWNTHASARVRLITGPTESFRWPHLDSASAGGSTPTGIGVWECGRLLERTRPDHKLLIVVTDGNPNMIGREGDFADAVDEAATTVEQLRNRGLTVFGFGFGAVDESKLDRIFGTDDGQGYRYADLSDLADALVELYDREVDRLDGPTTAPV